jgi:hypothetical protein
MTFSFAQENVFDALKKRSPVMITKSSMPVENKSYFSSKITHFKNAADNKI